MIIKENWNNLIEKIATNDPQFSFEYASLSFKSEMFYLSEGGKTAFLIFIHDSKSRSFETPYGYGSFWSDTADDLFLNEFFASFHAEMSKRGCIAGLIRFNPFIHIPKTEIFHTEFVRDVVYIDLEENYSKKFSSRTKGDIKRASRHNLEIRESSDRDDFIIFSSLYSHLMNEKGASDELLFGEDYFHGMRGVKGSFVMIAEESGEPVGGALFIHGESVSYYHLSAVRDKKRYPGLSTLLLHSGIEALHRRRGKKVLLGGGMTSAKDDPLLFFKEGFSPLKLRFSIGKMIVDEGEYRRLTDEHDRSAVHKSRLFLRYK